MSTNRSLSTEPFMMDTDMSACIKVFSKFDPKNSGNIDLYDLKPALEQMNIKFAHSFLYYKQLTDLKIQNNYINLYEFARIVGFNTVKKIDTDNSDILDAYVAMGGMEDGDGHIDAEKLINTIKNEMGMTIDIEKLIEEIDEDGNGEIEFCEFQS